MAAAAVLGRSEAGRANRARWGSRNPLGPEGGKPESRGTPAGETRWFGWKGAHPWIAFSAPWGPGNPNPTRAGVPAAGDGDSKEMVPWLLFPGYHPPHPQWLSPESHLGVRRSPPLHPFSRRVELGKGAGSALGIPGHHGNPAIGTRLGGLPLPFPAPQPVHKGLRGAALGLWRNGDEVIRSLWWQGGRAPLASPPQLP